MSLILTCCEGSDSLFVSVFEQNLARCLLNVEVIPQKMIVLGLTPELVASNRTTLRHDWHSFYNVVVMVVLILVGGVFKEAVGFNLDNASKLLLQLDIFSSQLSVVDIPMAFHLILEIIVGGDSLEFGSLIKLVFQEMLDLVIIVP